MNRSRTAQALGPLRIPFLILTPACLMPAFETALQETGQVSVLRFLLVLTGALAAHVSVNTFNEYFDFRSGLDLHTARTPFSGGSGTLPANPALAAFTLTVAVTSLLLSVLLGIYFLWLVGPVILPIGLLGVLTVVSYTGWITRHPLLCLLAPGFAFGPLMVIGTHLVLTGNYALNAVLVSLVPFFLVNNLLLLNQLPDIAADSRVGRRTFPIVFGLAATRRIYAVFLVLAFASLPGAVLMGQLPPGSLLGLATLPLAVAVLAGLWRHGEDISRLRPVLGMNVAMTVLTPLLIAIGMHLQLPALV